MKSNLIKVAFVAAIALVSGANVFNAQKSEPLSDVALANVEALAMSEWVPGKGWVCFDDVRDDTNMEHFLVVVFCRDCSSHSATQAYSQSYCTYSGRYD